jgi:cytoskeletal protein RodZ
VTSWLRAKFGRMRVSTMVLIVAFFALFWVYHNFEPKPEPAEAPPTAVVPPGFVPDPNYTWVPRTNVRRPREPVTTTTTTPTTTSPTETTTTSPGETTTPTSPTETTPTTTVIPGLLGPQTVTVPPTVPPATPPAPAPGPALTTPAPPG